MHTGFFSTAPTEGTMNANEWLQANNKEPYHPEEEYSYDNWYWMTYLYYHGKVFTQEEIDAEGDGHWTLPIPIWNHLQSKTTYPYCKMYDTRDEALEDFRQAYDKAVAEGWSG